MNITIQYHERQIGPYTLEEVNRRLRDGKIKPDALAWQEGTEGWVPLKTILGVGVPVSASPVPKPRVVKPKSYQKPVVWCCAGLALLVLIDIGIRLRSDTGGIEIADGKSPVLGQEKKPSPIGESAKPKKSVAEKAANARRIRGRILQVTEQGLMVNAKEDAPVFGVGNSTGNGGGVFIPSGRTDKHGAGRPAKIYGSFFVAGHPKQSTLVDDTEIDVDAYEDGVVTFTTVLGARRTVKLYAVVKTFE